MTGTAGGLLKYGHYRAHRWDNAIASIDPDKIYNGGQLGEVTIKGTRSSNYMGAAGAFAATAAIADGPLPVGDIVGLTALAGTAIYTYSGVDLVQKMNAEIAGIMARTMGPQGVQYSLRATESGTYLCHTCPGGTTQLNAGDVWKYGETTKGPQRYTLKYLRSNNVTFTPETAGNQIQIKVAEKLKLYNYFFRNGHLPGGNKIFR